MEGYFPRAKSEPTKEEARSQVQRRIKRLAQVRALIRDTSEDRLLCYPAERLYDRWKAMHPHTIFRSNTIVSLQQTKRELEQARLWLLQIIRLQARHLHTENMSRLFSCALAKPANAWSDLEKLYMALADEHGDVEANLEYALSVVLHYQYAENHADTLSRLQEQEDRRVRHEKKRSLPRPSEEAIRDRILHKLQSVEVNSFACPVPISSFTQSINEDSGACPICRNDYLDLTSFRVEDLIADYPVRIKYCGHIIGRGCLERWMETPLADPAKYPHRTCPLCRKAIEGVELPIPPQIIRQHVEENQKAISLADRLGLEDEECWDALLGLLSDEIVLNELEAEVKGKMLVHRQGQGYLRNAHNVLRGKLEELQEEKTVWGFGCDQEIWTQAKLVWANTSVRP